MTVGKSPIPGWQDTISPQDAGLPDWWTNSGPGWQDSGPAEGYDTTVGDSSVTYRKKAGTPTAAPSGLGGGFGGPLGGLIGAGLGGGGGTGGAPAPGGEGKAVEPPPPDQNMEMPSMPAPGVDSEYVPALHGLRQGLGNRFLPDSSTPLSLLERKIY